MCISRLICVLSLDCITKVYKTNYKNKSPQGGSESSLLEALRILSDDEGVDDRLQVATEHAG